MAYSLGNNCRLKNKMFFNSTITPNLIWVDLAKFDFSSKIRSESINPLDVSLVGDISEKLGAEKLTLYKNIQKSKTTNPRAII